MNFINNAASAQPDKFSIRIVINRFAVLFQGRFILKPQKTTGSCAGYIIKHLKINNICRIWCFKINIGGFSIFLNFSGITIISSMFCISISIFIPFSSIFVGLYFLMIVTRFYYSLVPVLCFRYFF